MIFLHTLKTPTKKHVIGYLVTQTPYACLLLKNLGRLIKIQISRNMASNDCFHMCLITLSSTRLIQVTLSRGPGLMAICIMLLRSMNMLCARLSCP